MNPSTLTPPVLRLARASSSNAPPDEPSRRPRRAARPAWSPWTMASRPSTTSEESRFVRVLADAAAGVGNDSAEFARPDVTLLLNALRCGLTVPRLVEVAPGVRPERLLAAYRHLDAALERAIRAWHDLTAADATSVLAELERSAEEAAKLLPGQVMHLTALARERPAGVVPAIGRMDTEIEAQRAHAQRIEAEIELHARLVGPEPDHRAAELGALLYDPFGECVANRSDFLPERVGLLSPSRVAALLGERRSPLHPV